MANKEKLDDYNELVIQFGNEHKSHAAIIKNVLSNNLYNQGDILEIMECYRDDKY